MAIQTTNLSNKKVLRELGKTNNLVKKLRLLPLEEVRAANKLQWIVERGFLRARLHFKRFAQNLGSVHFQIAVSCPRTIAHILFHLGPAAPVVSREMCLGVALNAHAFTIFVADPEKIIRGWMEVEHLRTKRVRGGWRISRVP